MKKAKQILSILLAVFMVLSAVPVAFAAGDGEPLTVELSGNPFVSLGSGQQYYDEDGYILTGDSEASIVPYESCSVTFDNLTAYSFLVDGADRSFNVVLKGDNEITYNFRVSDHDFEISAVDGATLTVPRMSTGGNDGTVTVNSGTVNIAPETEDSAYAVDCGDFIVNGGTVTASNASFETVNGPVHLNGGTLCIINTSSSYAAVAGDIIIGQGALLTISGTAGLCDSAATIEKADGLGENDSFFVRDDTESEFVPVADIKAALDGKTYAEIKIDTHTHSYTDGICGCGHACTHENKTDGECPDCGFNDMFIEITMHDSYGDGWNGNKLLIKTDSGEEIGSATIIGGVTDTYSFLLAVDVIFTLTWQKGPYSEECTFEVAVDGETVFESENGDAYEDGEVVYTNCAHTFEDGVCTKCGNPCLHDTDNGTCSICGEYIYAITHQPTEAEPYVELNDDTDATYQWYKVEDKEEITDENADTVSYDWGDSSYDAETGWTGVLYDEGSDEYDFFTVALHAGDTVKVELTGDFYDYVGLYDYATDEGSYEEIEPGINTYEITVTDDGDYTFYTYVNSGAVTVKAYMGDLVCSAIEGETEAALSNPAYGNRYLCEVTFADGTTEKSDILDLTYRITHQPTEAEPYVELNNDTDASYQWYKVEDMEEITDENADTVSCYGGDSSYDAETGWIGVPYYEGLDEHDFFTVALHAGDTVKVELTGDFNEWVGLFDYETEEASYEEVESGVNTYEITVTADGNYTFYTYVASGVVTAKAYLGDFAIEGETDARLQNPEFGAEYFCEVTFADGTTEKSDILDLSYRITHQPTEAEPYVELNDDTDASYQWYKLEYGTTEITDENATVMDGDIRNADYVPGEGWQVGLQYHYVEGHYLSHVFERVFEAGDQIILDITTTETDPELWLGGSDDFNYVGFTPDENGRLCATVELTDSYQLFSGNLYDPDMIIKAYLYSKNTYVELDGETDARLQNPAFGAEYYCAVTFADGTTEESDILDLTYRITHQPTEAEPYVELNNDTDASYQWYVFERKTVEITDENAVAITPENFDFPAEMFTQLASYDPSFGWQSSVAPQESGNAHLFFAADLKAGDVVNVTFSAAPDDSILLTIDGDKIADAETEDGINYSFTVLEDGLYGLQALCNDLLSAKASMLTDVSSKPEGEIDACLQSMEYGKKYFCEVTFADGTTEESDILDLTYRITHQPTAGEPYVELNDDTDASYQWHEIEYGTIEITDENAKALSGSICDAVYISGEGWYIGLSDPYPDGTYTIYAFERDFEAGDQIILDVTTTQTDYNLWLGGDGDIDSVEFMPDENGKLCATVAQDGTYGLFSGNVYDTAMIIKAYLYSKTYVALESQTDARLQNPEFGEEYFCEVTFADGTSEVSDSFEYKYAITHQPTEEEPYVELNYDTDASYQWHTVEEGMAEITDEKATGSWSALGAPSELHGEYDSEIGWTSSEGYYFVIELQEGETVELEASESVSEWWIAYAQNPGMYTDEWTVEQYGTTISFTATADGYYGFSISNGFGVAVRAYMEGNVYTAVDGQTTDTLTPDAIGHYACEVTFADGTTEMSDTFEVTSVHTCDFSGDWVYDNAKHWKECTVDDCNAVSEETEHEFLDGECTVCDYVCDHANATAEL
ncbi:MAG: hypothetical protein IJC45_06545, partial [Clostridia bacterium]|nr:hypothetical protein [Clostridia bacterium]